MDEEGRAEGRSRGGRKRRPGPPPFNPPSSSSPPSDNSPAVATVDPRPPPSAPEPKELIDRYVAKGMDRDAAGERVIRDLQAALQRSWLPMQRMASVDRALRSASSTLDSTAIRLQRMEAKLDSKPGLPQVFLAGVAAGALVQSVVASSAVIAGALHSLRSSIQRLFQR